MLFRSQVGPADRPAPFPSFSHAFGHLGWFDPKTGRTELIALAQRSSPHGVIQGPDKAAWITDGAQNAIVRVGWPDRKVMAFPAGRFVHRAHRPAHRRVGRDRAAHPRNAVFAFEPGTEKFERYAMPRANANIRHILGRPGEIWLPESGTEHISVIRTA